MVVADASVLAPALLDDGSVGALARERLSNATGLRCAGDLLR